MRDLTNLLLAVLLPLVLATSVPAQLALDSSVIACGGGASAGGAYGLTGTVGQPDAGTQQAGTGLTLDGGFWATIGAEDIVTNSNDSGPGSLRDVVAAAAPGSTVTFAPSLDGSTIALTTGQIVLDKDLGIDASELGEGVIISGSDTSRVFQIASGQSIHLINLDLTGGNGVGTTASGTGGAIYNVGTLSLTDCTIAGNASASATRAGALYSNGAGSSITALRCGFSGNTAGGSYVGTGASPVNALLSALSDHGDLTLTMLPLPGSPTIGTAVASALAIDQRGYPRHEGVRHGHSRRGGTCPPTRMR